jgi:hypothetical protein
MSVIDPRNRLVNFRLSEGEFERLRQACVRFRARSVSEFARNAVLQSLEESLGAGRPSPGRLAALDQKVCELEIRIEQLLRLVGAAGRGLLAHAPALALSSEVEALGAVCEHEGRPAR